MSATFTAAQACNAAIVSLSVIFLYIVIDGLVGAAIACWQDVSRKPQAASEDFAPAYHYACPLTCELPAPSQEPTQAVEPQVTLEAVAPAPQVLEEAVAPPTKAKRLTYAQQVKAEFSEFFKMPITTKDGIKSALINRSDVTFMQAVNLERTGNDFYRAAHDQLERIKKAKQAKLEQSA